MDKLNVICVDDKPDMVLALVHDLAELNDWVRFQSCYSAEDALQVMAKLDSQGFEIGLVISDQHMPGKNGVQLLESIAQDGRFRHTKTMMLSGNASKDILLDAINLAHVDRFYEKPWDKDVLLTHARELLTEYVFARGIDYMALQSKLDAGVILKHMSRTTG